MEFRLKDNSYETMTDFGNLTMSSDENYGFRPFQLMVSSIAVCSGTVMKKIMDKKRINIEDLRIKADVTRNEAEANRIESIHLTFVVTADNLKPEQMEKIMHLTAKNCSMVQSVKDSITVTETFELK